MSNDHNERKYLLSNLSEELVSTSAYAGMFNGYLCNRVQYLIFHSALRHGLLSLCKDISIDNIYNREELVEDCIKKLDRTTLKREVQNAVFTRLHGLQANKHNHDEYVPEEPDWIVSGRIKWLKRVSKGLESLATELGM